MNLTLTLREALEIQDKQIEYYSKYRKDLKEVIKSKTNIIGYDLDKPMPIIEVNKLVPRGGTIEYICGLSDVQRNNKKRQREEAMKMFNEWRIDKLIKENNDR